MRAGEASGERYHKEKPQTNDELSKPFLGFPIYGCLLLSADPVRPLPRSDWIGRTSRPEVWKSNRYLAPYGTSSSSSRTSTRELYESCRAELWFIFPGYRVRCSSKRVISLFSSPEPGPGAGRAGQGSGRLRRSGGFRLQAHSGVRFVLFSVPRTRYGLRHVDLIRYRNRFRAQPGCRFAFFVVLLVLNIVVALRLLFLVFFFVWRRRLRFKLCHKR